MTVTIKHLLHSSVLFLLIVLPGQYFITDSLPVADETVYARFAYSIYQFQTFGKAGDPGQLPQPSAHVAPVLPAWMALNMFANTQFAQALACTIAKSTAADQCNQGVIAFKQMNLVYLALCFIVIWHLLLQLSGSLSLAYATCGLILVSGAPWYFADHYLTETLYVPVAFIFCLLLTRGLISARYGLFFLSGVVLGVLALIRPSFYYLFYILLVLLPVIVCLILKTNYTVKKTAGVTGLYLLGFILVVSPWMIRNYQLFDRPTITVGYGAFTLSSRVSYNAMTDREYLAAWVYWLPDFGDSLAEHLFGYEQTHRLDFGNTEGFIRKERQHIRLKVREQTQASISHHETGQEISPVSWLIREYVLNDFINHNKVTLVLAWRGIFVEKYFGLLGVLCLLLVCILNPGTHFRRDLLLISLPGVILLFFHASLTASIPRYNLIMLLPMAFSMACLLQGAVSAIRTKPDSIS